MAQDPLSNDPNHGFYTDSYLHTSSTRMDEWMTCNFTSFSQVFQSYQDDGGMIFKCYVQWNPVYGLEDFALTGARTGNR